MSIFVDTSVWFGAANTRDKYNARAKQILTDNRPFVMTDHILIETRRLLSARVHRLAAEAFWSTVRSGAAEMEKVTTVDLEAAWAIGEAFADQDFSIVERTSFAVMERLGLTRVASFDDHFAIYRYGRNRDRASALRMLAGPRHDCARATAAGEGKGQQVLRLHDFTCACTARAASTPTRRSSDRPPGRP